MAGHNKWSKIKHRKAVVDKRRSKVWTKVARAIVVAARHGGPDPNFNLSLRYAMDEARYANMPRDVVDRAIQKGAGGGDMSQYEVVRYEGYAPGGVAIIIDALTDNRTRTAGDVRLAFSDANGNMGATGCVAYMFQPRGRISVAPKGVVEDALVDCAASAGALDVQPPPPHVADDDDGDTSPWTILTEVGPFNAVREAIEKAGFTIVEAGLTMVPDTSVLVRGEQAKGVIDLVDALEDLDDVQKVYSNAEIPDDVLAELG